VSWKPRDLTGVVVSLGPGSYTGLRVGVISAKVLAYATGCAVLGIPTFEVIALQAPLSARRIEVLADAQKDKVYCQPFERSADGILRPAAPLAIVPWNTWAANVPPGAVVTGPGALKYPDRLPPEVTVLPAEVREPLLSSLLARGLERLRRGERDDPYALEPLYLRASSAEEQWDTLQRPS
jgi:tRNA threonylcarbamoyladenosine biosynthesis protein TsaB